jgi:hypothetical protein
MTGKYLSAESAVAATPLVVCLSRATAAFRVTLVAVVEVEVEVAVAIEVVVTGPLLLPMLA